MALVSCKKEKGFAPNIALDEMTDTAAVLRHSGTFTSGPYGTVTGNAEVYKTATVIEVKLADFTSGNGPALHVFISKEAMPVNFIDSGVLNLQWVTRFIVFQECETLWSISTFLFTV